MRNYQGVASDETTEREQRRRRQNAINTQHGFAARPQAAKKTTCPRRAATRTICLSANSANNISDNFSLFDERTKQPKGQGILHFWSWSKIRPAANELHPHTTKKKSNLQQINDAFSFISLSFPHLFFFSSTPLPHPKNPENTLEKHVFHTVLTTVPPVSAIIKTTPIQPWNNVVKHTSNQTCRMARNNARPHYDVSPHCFRIHSKHGIQPCFNVI